MKLKQLLILLVAAVVVAAAGYIIYERYAGNLGGTEGDVTGEPVLPEMDVNAVAEIVIKDAQYNVTLKRHEGNWVVVESHDYPADFQKIRKLLLDLSEMKIAQSVKGGERFLERLNLLEPTGETIASGVLLELRDSAGKALHSLVLGKDHERKTETNLPYGGSYPDGRYIRVKQSGLLGLVSETFSSVTTEKSRWLDSDFFKVGPKKSILLVDGGETVWQFTRQDEGDDLVMTGEIPDGKELDESAVSSLSSCLGYPSFTDVVAPDAPDEETGMDTPRICRVVDFDGIQYDISIGKKVGDQYHVRVAVTEVGPTQRPPVEGEDEAAAKKADEAFEKALEERRAKIKELTARLDGWTYLVKSYVVSAVDKQRDDFLKDEPEPEPEDGNAKEKQDSPE